MTLLNNRGGNGHRGGTVLLNDQFVVRAADAGRARGEAAAGNVADVDGVCAGDQQAAAVEGQDIAAQAQGGGRAGGDLQGVGLQAAGQHGAAGDDRVVRIGAAGGVQGTIAGVGRERCLAKGIAWGGGPVIIRAVVVDGSSAVDAGGVRTGGDEGVIHGPRCARVQEQSAADSGVTQAAVHGQGGARGQYNGAAAAEDAHRTEALRADLKHAAILEGQIASAAERGVVDHQRAAAHGRVAVVRDAAAGQGQRAGAQLGQGVSTAVGNGAGEREVAGQRVEGVGNGDGAVERDIARIVGGDVRLQRGSGSGSHVERGRASRLECAAHYGKRSLVEVQRARMSCTSDRDRAVYGQRAGGGEIERTIARRGGSVAADVQGVALYRAVNVGSAIVAQIVDVVSGAGRVDAPVVGARRGAPRSS